MSLNAIRENKILAKISEFTVILYSTKLLNARQLPGNKMASKMAAQVFSILKGLCIAFILFLNCSQMDTPYRTLIDLHQNHLQTKSFFGIPYKWSLK